MAAVVLTVTGCARHALCKITGLRGLSHPAPQQPYEAPVKTVLLQTRTLKSREVKTLV